MMKIDRLSVCFLLKARAFHKMGYKSVTAKQIRSFCEEFLWKRNKPATYKQLKRTIQHITPNQFFDYQTLLIKMDTTTRVEQIDLNQLDRK